MSTSLGGGEGLLAGGTGLSPSASHSSIGSCFICTGAGVGGGGAGGRAGAGTVVGVVGEVSLKF